MSEPTLDLTAPVETLKGIGPKRAEILHKAGIWTVRDFFYNLPRDYDNYAAPTTIRAIQPGKVVLKGKIDSLSTRRTRRRNLAVTEGVIRDQTGAIKVVWFNQSYRARQFEPGKEYLFMGSYEFRNRCFQLTSPSAVLASEAEELGGLVPIYVAHGGLKTGEFRRFFQNAQEMFAAIPDLLPLVTPRARAEALFKVHFPKSERDIEWGRQYLAYEELFLLLLAAKLNRLENEKLTATALPFDVEKIRKLVGSLPFKLTDAQRRASWEIFQDMQRETPMNRLLQGDVGSGKTVVAAMAAYEAVTSGVQVALLAPTAILASQHYESLSQLLHGLGVRVVLLTGATKGKPALKKAIAKGDVDLVIGTHALLTDDTKFSKLGLTIIDEQHRFGVEQRQKLLLKSPNGLAPHLLSMTATPIPRSLELTVFGDLDVSILNELPAGRQEIKTEIVTEVEMRERLYPMMQSVLSATPDARGVARGSQARGQQIYWICRAIEDASEKSTALESGATSVKQRAKKLAKVFPEARIETLHGKMKPADKDAVMEKFSRGEIDILVSTTVVEVGVDVPNATLIVIENAEEYGLAQLHQLRGRVGRGVAAARCVLLTSGDASPSRRLQELVKSSSGFHLAEVDLKLRGPGEIYGVLQHGALDLRIASLTDTRLIARAKNGVEKFIKSGQDMLQYREMMAGISRYQQMTTLN